MKYIIDIPKEYESDWVNKSSRLGFELCFPIYETSTNKKYHTPTGLKLESYIEPDRKAIEDEVWEFATTCIKMDGADSVDVFGGYSLDSFTKYSYQEAKAKYDAWKKRKDEIHVGDEVVLYENVKMVVTQVDHGTSIQGVDENGECYESIDCNVVKKTGRHFAEIEELLKKLGGE